MRSKHIRVALVALAAASLAFTVVPTPAAAQTVDPSCQVSDLIAAYFPDDLGWAIAVAKRESGCDPCAHYPSRHDCTVWNPSTAKGVFQLLGHDDLIHAACPYLYPLPWQHPECGIIAARYLYDSSGRSPWGG